MTYSVTSTIEFTGRQGKSSVDCSSMSAPPADGKPPTPKGSKPKPKPKEKKDEPERQFYTLMLFPTSGRVGFDRIKWPESGPAPIEKEPLKLLLTTERDLRLSSECQQRFSDVGMDAAGLASVTEWVQRKALEQCGYQVTDRNLLMLRSALSIYPEVRASVSSKNPILCVVSVAFHYDQIAYVERTTRYRRSRSTIATTAASRATSRWYELARFHLRAYFFVQAAIYLPPLSV